MYGRDLLMRYLVLLEAHQVVSLVVFLDVWSSYDFLNFVLLFVFRWIYLNDQNLCIPASSSFVYGAVPIGASIYVIGDLDTGKNVMMIFVRTVS